MTVNDVLGLIGSYLHDTSHVVWGSDLKVSFINEAIQAVAMVRPDASAKTVASHALTADTSRQEIPSDGARFLHLTRNAVTGSPIRKISKEALAESCFSWRAQTITEIEFFLFDEEDPLHFDVHPVPDSALTVGLVYSAVPATVAAGDNLSISSVYQPAILDYALYRCFGMETKGADRQKAMNHLQTFYNSLGVKMQNDLNLKALQEAR